MQFRKVLEKLDREELKEINKTGTLSLPDDITEIEKYTFHNLDKLKTITLPKSLRSVKKHSFYNCGLEEVRLQSLPILAPDAFGHCPNIKRVILSYDIAHNMDREKTYQVVKALKMVFGYGVWVVGDHCPERAEEDVEEEFDDEI